MFNKLRNNRTGFTLIELLAALAVLSMLVVMLFLAFTNCNRMMVLGSNQMEKNQVVRAVLQQIGRDIERTAYSSTAVNLFASGPSETITGSGISNSTLYCLSTLATEEGNALGTVVNVGYQIAKDTTTTYGVSVSKWVLQRGDDAYVDPNSYPTSWWSFSVTNSTFWKTISDNILGVTFQFYPDPISSPQPSWSSLALPNSLPTSVGISIWAIDSDNYNRALKLDSTLSSSAALQIILNNIHKYTSRVFLPQSTQN